MASADTNTRQTQSNELIAKQLQSHPALAAMGDGQDESIGGGSAMGTPRASVAPSGGTKLRLTMGSAAVNGSAPGSGTD